MKRKKTSGTLVLSMMSMLILSVDAKSPQSQRTGKVSQMEQYADSIPKPTLSEVAYGPHERNVLDFWKAKSDKPTPLASLFMVGVGKMGARKGSVVLSMLLPC
jgi:hypothetical protein